MAVNPYETREGRLHRLVDVSRRKFLILMGTMASAAAVLFGGFKVLGFMYPNATGEEPLAFKVDQDPASITIGQPLQITEKRVSIIRDQKGYYCVYLLCTHLGCTPNYVSDVAGPVGVSLPERYAGAKGGWACPCHGSRYYIDSTNFYGPAPRPMDWVMITFSPDGSHLLIDRGKHVVQRTAGDTTVPEWRLDPVTKKPNNKTLGV